MKWFPKYPHSGLATPRRSVPRLEQLESRQVLSVTSVGVAFSPHGPEVLDVVYGNGALYQFVAGSKQFLRNNVRSAAWPSTCTASR